MKHDSFLGIISYFIRQMEVGEGGTEGQITQDSVLTEADVTFSSVHLIVLFDISKIKYYHYFWGFQLSL